MLLLFVCSGLMFVVVSASSNNETSTNGINASTVLPTLSNLSSTEIPSSNSCTLNIKDSEILEIVELFNNNLVHVLNISVSLSDASYGKKLLSDFHVQLMNPVGREILLSLGRFKAFR